MAERSDINIEEQADILVQKIKYYLITMFGRVLDAASADEYYHALCYALRERIMVNWQATAESWLKSNARMLYYLSMEYLPGRFLGNNVLNLHEQEVVARVLQKTNRNVRDIVVREGDPGLGNGGLGRLAACFLDSLATLKMPSRGYGLRYQYGLFEQQLWDGVQIEKPDTWLWNVNPWEFRRDHRRVHVKFCGTPQRTQNQIGEETYELQDYEEVSALPYDVPIIGYSQDPHFAVVTLRLWSTKESPRNFELQRYNAGRLDQAAENMTLSDVLYPSDHHEAGRRTRLKQEYLLVSASVQDMIRHYFTSHSDITEFADKVRIQINDTHPTLIIAELIRVLVKQYNIPWSSAVEITRTCTSYTNHTVLAEALEQWDQNLFRTLLPRQYRIIEKLNFELCAQVRTRFPNDEARVQRVSIIENGFVRMANLAVDGSHFVNGVAALHSEIIKHTIFKDFYDLFPDRFGNVTNGVTPRRWLAFCNRELAAFITARIGNSWIADFSQISKLAAFASDEASQKEFLQIKKNNKDRLLSFLRDDWRPRDSQGDFTPSNVTLDSSALFDIQIKRVHEYKRQLLKALHLIMQYQDILDNPTQPRQKRLVLFAGKAAASYETAKTIIRLICCLEKKINNNPMVNKYLNVVYVENYNVSRAEIIIPASDLSEQISTAGMEASGTGNMKLAMNGSLTIGTDDGANVEMREAIGDEWWPFLFGCSAKEIEDMRAQRSYKAWDIYSSNPKIKRAVDALKDRSLTSQEVEHQSLSSLYYTLLEGSYGSMSDRYFVLKDLQAYADTQLKVEALYQQPAKWAEYALHNIAGMGMFSTDRAIQDYSDRIWHLTPVGMDAGIFRTVQDAYVESSPYCLV